ncbi:putative calcium-binding protein CML15 [Hibiscus syriacus]|uniref:Calcium-binding protein CML15 n=1 Tax=Hibiscus syriacus TaxID=106335 RepID=A0A6A2ZDC4_HIBSY|nr:putative calcium-binding protein CML15 [Hibiscus syriacus]
MVAIHVEQLNQLKDIFARFDMDSDGILTILEFAALLRSLRLKPSGDQNHFLLANMDSNGNGAVEFDELVNAIMPHMNEQMMVNQKQLKEPVTYKELTEMIREADADGDGVISFNGFSTVMAKSAFEFLGIHLSS